MRAGGRRRSVRAIGSLRSQGVTLGRVAGIAMRRASLPDLCRIDTWPAIGGWRPPSRRSKSPLLEYRAP